MEKYKKISSKYLVENNFIKVRKQLMTDEETEKKMSYYLMEFTDWVNVVPITEDNKVILIKQYRPGTDSICIEIPGGMADLGEDPIVAAKRELAEETGYSSSEFQLLKTVSGNPAIQNNFVHCYIAKGVKKSGDQNLDEDEKIEILEKSMPDVIKMLENGEIHHPYGTLSLILALQQYGYYMGQ